MPLQVPVYKRERANAMYTPAAYYWGRFLSALILQLAYPLIFVLCVFFGLGIDESLANFLDMFFVACLLTFTMSAQGWFCGSLSDNEQVAQQTNTFIILIFMLTSGGLGSAASFPAFIKWVSYISPQRYACQGFFYRLIKQVPEKNAMGFVVRQ